MQTTLYGWVILGAILTGFVLDAVAMWLNLHAMGSHPPAGFEECVNKTVWARTRDYALQRARPDLIASATKLVALLAWWFGGGFPWMDRIMHAWNLGPLATGVIYIGLSLFLAKLVSLPFKIYITFVVEARFGFNRTTWTTFVADKAKGLLLSLVLGGPFLIAVLVFFQYTGERAWLYCWATASTFLVVITYIAPIWLMPLFNRFTPLPEGPLRQAILAYAASVSVPLGDVCSLDGSRRTTRTNAFVTGYGRYRRIALFDTLIARNGVEELVAILAHETGHIRLRHIPKMTLFAIGYLGALCALLAMAMHQPELHHTFYMERITLHGGVLFFIMLVSPLDLVMGPLMKGISRHYEYAADRFAATTIPDPGALITALKKLAADNLSNLTPHPFHVFLHHTHPPLPSRIRAIEQLKNRP